MNNQAQELWKYQYRAAMKCRRNEENYEAAEHLCTALRYRREAALERKLEAAQRRIAQLENDINELFEPNDNYPPEYSEMDLLQREAAGLP